MYLFLHPYGFLCSIFIATISAKALSSDSNEKNLKTAFGLSIASIFFILFIIFYLCYKNYKQYRHRLEEDQAPLAPGEPLQI